MTKSPHYAKMPAMKRVVTVQDISCLGKCSLTVALPLISAMGVEACILPTAILSTHTAFKGFTFHDLTSEIKPICDHWKEEKIHFDAIYTGYLGSFDQLKLVENLIDDFAATDTFTIVDPCMADNGKLYTGFNQDFAFAMARLCSKANVILPNLTEACFMLGIPYKEKSYDLAYIKDLVKKLAALGAQKVILKGLQFEEDEEELKGVKNKIGILSYDSQSDRFDCYFHKKLPVNFHGTGDIFASVLTAALMRGYSLKKSYTLAADFVVESIKASLSHQDYNWYGVDFEAAIPYLIKRIS